MTMTMFPFTTVMGIFGVRCIEIQLAALILQSGATANFIFTPTLSRQPSINTFFAIFILFSLNFSHSYSKCAEKQGDGNTLANLKVATEGCLFDPWTCR